MSFSEWDWYHYPWCKTGCRDIQISLWEIFREKFRFTLAPKGFSHEQSHISKALFYQQNWHILRRSELSCGKHSFAARVLFCILKGPIWSAWSVQVSLTSFMLLTNVAVPAGAAASLALEIHRQSPQLIPACLTPGSLLAAVIARGNVGIAGESSGWEHV